QAPPLCSPRACTRDSPWNFSSTRGTVPGTFRPQGPLAAMSARQESAAPAEPRRASRLARSTAIFSLATGLSRILGLVREIVARYYFGTVGAINAFEVAFLIPNTLRAL